MSIKCLFGFHDWVCTTKQKGIKYYKCRRCGKKSDELELYAIPEE
jgi:tRNA(Ile2) C34 agmatinyltransferase TiaS